MDYAYLDIPEGTGLDVVIRIGHVQTALRQFIHLGMVKQEGSRFIKTYERHTTSTDPATKPNPFSLRELQKRGFQVMAGKTEADDAVMIMPGSYCRIKDALRNGLLNITTQPI